jgi:DnaK suppressor protein
MRELDLATEVLFESRVGQVDDALRRLDDGTYGICAACGKPIPAERLELVPETPYCVADAAKQRV